MVRALAFTIALSGLVVLPSLASAQAFNRGTSPAGYGRTMHGRHFHHVRRHQMRHHRVENAADRTAV